MAANWGGSSHPARRLASGKNTRVRMAMRPTSRISANASKTTAVTRPKAAPFQSQVNGTRAVNMARTAVPTMTRPAAATKTLGLTFLFCCTP